MLFKNVPKESFKQHGGDRFVVLIWKHWKWLQSRHVHGFNTSGESDPLSQCSVKNCVFTGNNTLLDTVDAVVVHIQKGEFPKTVHRNRDQRWIFLNDESPMNAFSMSSSRPKLSQLANLFNWSMTYRSDADIPVPYGRTVALPKSPDIIDDLTKLIPNWSKKRRDVLPTVLMSNCGVSYRMKYLKELKQHIEVDVHGKCSDKNKKSCPGHFKADCELMSQYLFYLVFENSKCKEYLTEKSFYHAYSKGAIPVFLGPPLEDCEKLLPPNSFLHVDNFQYPKDLAEEMVRIANDQDRLLSFHQWRANFEVRNEHGYFGSRSFHLCRVCEALNYNDEKEKVYSEKDLEEFLNPTKTCS
ncbi:4-galactosyl-N-acetylglucosaminide 3-alpha-L-fucosyltransferase FUT6-like [Epargyreus clarus]|uniref:4-galactosyl-N-acetylglucosaminide 3-alpha-L-fucosyltransferase FUT6-like n=1 Tax=Epargyreus clarus TaxID=520877 RepID=UPI003C2F25B6